MEPEIGFCSDEKFKEFLFFSNNVISPIKMHDIILYHILRKLKMRISSVVVFDTNLTLIVLQRRDILKYLFCIYNITFHHSI